MTSKEIGRVSTRIFQGQLPSNWVCRSQEDQEDYGVDFELEIMEKDRATGLIFKAQLKGTASPEYDGQGQLIYHGADVARFEYYLERLKTPIIFVVCDNCSSKCYWCKVQGNRRIEGAVKAALGAQQKTFTIKFPATGVFAPVVAPEPILEAVEASFGSITIQSLQQVSTEVLRERITSKADAAKTEDDLRLLAGVAADEQIQRQIADGEFRAAWEKSIAIFESQSELPQVRILAGFNAYRAGMGWHAHDNKPNVDSQISRLKLAIASQMIPISRQPKCRRDLRMLVRCYVRSARLGKVGKSLFGLSISEKTQEKMGETLAGPLTQIQRMAAARIAERDFVAIQRNIRRMVDCDFMFHLPQVWADCCDGILPYVKAMRVLGRHEIADAYVAAMDRMLPYCVQIIQWSKEKDASRNGARMCAIMYLMLSNFDKAGEADARLKHVMSILSDKLGDPLAAEIEADIAAIVTRHGEFSNGAFKPSMEERKRSFMQLAAQLGIDLDSKDDDIAEIVRIGLADLDPTRVLKDCQHMFVHPESCGIPAEMLGLNTAGSKCIVCLKHGHGVSGLMLDQTYQVFRGDLPFANEERTCKNCPDKSPHPAGWQWSDEWHVEQAKRYHAMP